MKAWLVVNEFLHSDKFNEIHNWLLESAKKYKIDMMIKTNGQLMVDLIYNQEQKEEPLLVDFVLFWDKDIKLARYLEKLGYLVFNSSTAIEICDNKALTHLELLNKGILMPRTILSPMTYNNIGYTNYDFIKVAEEKLGYPMVIKEVYGSFGNQVYLVKNYKELLDIINKIGNKDFIFQEYIKTSHGKDIRIQVVGNKVITSMYRYSNCDDFRANLTIGGKMKEYMPSYEESNMAIKACKALGLDFAGVDILFGENNKPILCEVNSNAHFKNIFDCTGVNVANNIMEHIIGIIG